MITANRPATIRIRTLLLIAAAMICSVAWASEKKGVGLAELDAGDRIEALNLAWYYTWKPYPIEGASSADFVPMVSGGPKGKLFEKHLAYQKRQGRVPYLLVFNEPNKKHHGNKSVEEVLRLWPEVEGLADNLSSPAPSGVMRRWFDRFFHKARHLNLKMDFMAVHLYGPPDAELFLSKIDAVYRKYRMLIWITEFAVADWSAIGRPGANRYSEAQVLDFMKKVLPALEARPFIERYAWFGAGDYALQHESVRTSRLFHEDLNLTPLGRYYSAFSWPATEIHEPVTESNRLPVTPSPVR